MTRFGCPLTIVTNQGVHFINGTKKCDETISVKTCYFYHIYPLGNGQVKFTNKIIGKLLIKLVNEKRTN